MYCVLTPYLHIHVVTGERYRGVSIQSLPNLYQILYKFWIRVVDRDLTLSINTTIPGGSKVRGEQGDSNVIGQQYMSSI